MQPTLTLIRPPGGVRHHACPACDGEGLDFDRVDADGDYRDCSACRGTCDARCDGCDEPTQYLSSNRLCEECGSIDAAEAIVAEAAVRAQLYGISERTPKVAAELREVALASAEWAIERAWAEAIEENAARFPVDSSSLPY